MTDTEERRRTREKLERRRLVAPDGCWYWQGATTGNGYGWTGFRGRNEYAHRLSAWLHLGFDLESGLCVMHTCDHPLCFRPGHLRTGTQAENMRDASLKGRMSGKKLNSAQVARIKYELGRGATQRTLALEHGVSTTAIGQIARGQTWKSVQVPEQAPEQSDTEKTS